MLRARTAQTERWEGASKREQTWRYGSVLDDFKCRLMHSSGVKDTSLEDRCTKGLKCVVVVEVNLLERRKL